MENDMLSKYEVSVLKNIDINNMKKIITFLETKDCDFIDEILTDYLDIFTFDYKIFVEKYDELNKEYNNQLLEKVRNDMNILEKFYL